MGRGALVLVGKGKCGWLLGRFFFLEEVKIGRGRGVVPLFGGGGGGGGGDGDGDGNGDGKNRDGTGLYIEKYCKYRVYDVVVGRCCANG